MFTLCFILLPSMYTFHTTSFVNVLTHKIGYRNFDTNDNSTNLNIPIIPQSLHNNHHKYPSNIDCAIKWFEIDLSSFIIRLIKL